METILNERSNQHHLRRRPQGASLTGTQTVPKHLFSAAQSVKNLPAAPEIWFNSWVGRMPWRRQWQPTPGLLPGESHGQRSLVGCRPGGRPESAQLRTKTFTFTSSLMPAGPSPVLPELHGAPRLQCAHTQAAEAGKKDESSKRKPPSHLLVSAAPSWVNPEPSRPGAGCDQESSPFTRSTTSQPQTVQQRSPLLRNEAGHQGFYYENSYV